MGRIAHDLYDAFDDCRVLTRSYEEPFTDLNIKAGSRKTRVILLEAYSLLAQARPYSHREPSELASVDEMIKMLDTERKHNAEDILGDVMIHLQGFLDTRYGANVTSDAAMGLLRLQHAAKQRTKEQQEKKDAEAGAKLEAERQEKCVDRQAFQIHRGRVRSKRYYEPVVAIGSL
ncbi:hypothetical protein BWQ96_08239 [Gracilariopsis chorda]|uniref:Uncharacterized protein n=1 Tax=Gracilariopsis chorda TaxID=448386 RepID=A0A2V3IIY0_9FLOR|nr:hypothetical protein BWQ96_08239 [Gracilariopsis chorda]|eukprot:PXF42031.1 hypothetical protein BWQ96_08239 [Gracilariopsis chorda]